MADQLARRDATQPVKERSAGSTFRNPAGFSSTGRADDSHELKAWKVIDDAGPGGRRWTAARHVASKPLELPHQGGRCKCRRLEGLGEGVRRKGLFQHSAIRLDEEIIGVGRRARLQ